MILLYICINGLNFLKKSFAEKGVFKGIVILQRTPKTPYFNAVALKSFLCLYLNDEFYHTFEKNQNMLLHPP